MTGRYRVHEFAELTGVTIKALQHYDRLGLLKPARTAAGHRLYATRDRERLEQIVALKFLGIPLKQIKKVLDGDTVPLSHALGAQRAALELQRRKIERAIDAIERARQDLESGGLSDASILKQLTEIIMQNEAEAMRKYFSERAWVAFGHYYDNWPSPRWGAFYRDAAAALDEHPAGERAEALVARMFALWHEETGGDRQIQREVQAGMMKAWADRKNWPESLQRRFEEYKIDQVVRFISHAMALVMHNKGPAYFQKLQPGTRSVA